MALARLWERATIKEEDDDNSWDLDTVLARLRAARTELKDVQCKCREKRDESLCQQLEEEEKKARDSEDGDVAANTAKRIEAIIQSERQQASYTRIKQVFKNLAFGGGLQHLDVPKRDLSGVVLIQEDGTPIQEILLEVDDIHWALLECNKKHFHQAAATPFSGEDGNGILADLVGYSGIMAAAKEIVEGTFLETHGDLKDLLPETVQLISEMVMPEEIRKLGQIQQEITTNDFYSGFKSWKESTSTSPSG
jgi:hypothetical protein